MDGQDLLDRFELHDHQVLDKQIDPVGGVQRYPFVDDRYRPPSHESKLPRTQLVFETRRVRGFEETGSKDSMHLDRRADDFT